MISIIHIIGIVILHYLGDFVFQSQKMAEEKSSSFEMLQRHVLTYTSVFFVAVALLIWKGYFQENMFIFVFVTYATHLGIDYVTSRMTSYYWTNKKWHEFFVAIGGDQALHYIQLFVTYYFLMK